MSVGVYVSNYNNRFDTAANVLFCSATFSSYQLMIMFYQPKLLTELMQCSSASYSGYNQDDSVIINKSSLALVYLEALILKHMMERK